MLAIAAATAFLGTPRVGLPRRPQARRRARARDLVARGGRARRHRSSSRTGWRRSPCAVVLVYAARCATASLTDAIALDHLGDNRAAYGRVRLWTSVGWADRPSSVWGLVLRLRSDRSDAVPFCGERARHGHRRAPACPGRRLHAPPPRGSRRAMARGLALSSCFRCSSSSPPTRRRSSFIAIRIEQLGGGLFIIGVAAGLQAVAETPVMRASPRLAASSSDHSWYVVGSLVLAVSLRRVGLPSTGRLAVALVKLITASVSPRVVARC